MADGVCSGRCGTCRHWTPLAVCQSIGDCGAVKSLGQSLRTTHNFGCVAWQEKEKPIKPGLYRVHWKSGGTSLAAVGVNREGRFWFAPTNWVGPGDLKDHMKSIERLEPIAVNAAE